MRQVDPIFEIFFIGQKYLKICKVFELMIIIIIRSSIKKRQKRGSIKLFRTKPKFDELSVENVMI